MKNYSNSSNEEILDPMTLNKTIANDYLEDWFDDLANWFDAERQIRQEIGNKELQTVF